MTDHNMAFLNDPLVRTSVTNDDGRDWTAYLVWQSKARYRISQGTTDEPPPVRPQEAKVTIEPKKKPCKRGKRIVKQAIGAA